MRVWRTHLLWHTCHGKYFAIPRLWTMITFIVSSLNKPGGIQEFSKSIYHELCANYDMELLNWEEHRASSLTAGALARVPSSIGYPVYFRTIASYYGKKNSGLKNSAFIHFWDMRPAFLSLHKKYVVSCHGRELLLKNIRGFEKEAYRRILSNAQRIHVNSDYTKELLMKNFAGLDDGKVRIIPPCLPLESAINFPTAFCKERKLTIGTLTRFNRRKNVIGVIEALNILKEKYCLDFKYYLAGDGIQRTEIITKLKKASFEWKYFGPISEVRKINDFYPMIDIFAMPTLDLPDDVEGFGIVYLEANAFGIPVVASKVNGVPAAVKENVSGVFADPTNPEDMAVKILEVLRTKTKYAYSAKEWALKFEKNVIAREFAKMYDELLEKC